MVKTLRTIDTQKVGLLSSVLKGRTFPKGKKGSRTENELTFASIEPSISPQNLLYCQSNIFCSQRLRKTITGNALGSMGCILSHARFSCQHDKRSIPGDILLGLLLKQYKV